MNLTGPISLLNVDSQGASVDPQVGQSAADARTLAAVLESVAPLPPSALFVGLAEDGLPVLLNLQDHLPAPVLIAADAGAGKTRLLQTVARALERTHDPARLEYAVLTENPGEWTAFEHSPHSHGIFRFHHALTTGYLQRVALGTSPSIDDPFSLLLLIDGLEALISDGDLRQAAHALLHSPFHGSAIPLITLNTSNAFIPIAWLAAFRVRIFGYIRDQALASSLSSGPEFPNSLQPPAQFAARQADAWLPFWLPELD